MTEKHIVRYYDDKNNVLETYNINMTLRADDVRKYMIPTKILTSNDRHSSHVIEGDVRLTGILYKMKDPDQKERTQQNMIFKIEKMEDYEKKIQTMNPINRRWIYNIIEGTAECDNLLFENDEFVLMPDYTWDQEFLDKIHILAIVRNRTLCSIRDLKLEHLDMLQRIKQESLRVIETTYHIPANKLKVFLHYPPSTYLLHIHITHISKCDNKTSFEHSHDLDTLIHNIKLDESYYRRDMRIVDVDDNVDDDIDVPVK